MNIKKALLTVFILLMFLNLAQLTQNLYLTQGLLSREVKIGELTEDLSELRDVYQASVGELGKKEEELTDVQRRIISLERAMVKKKKWIYTLGVTEGQGVALKLTVEMEGGDGRLLADMKNVLLETDVQETMRSAFSAAQIATEADMSSEDFFFTLVNPLEESVVLTGESAGAAMAVALVALVEDRDIRDDVVITGAITRDGGIGRVSQLNSKAQAAKEAGAKTLLVPPGQKIEFSGLTIIEVKDLSEAKKYMLH